MGFSFSFLWVLQVTALLFASSLLETWEYSLWQLGDCSQLVEGGGRLGWLPYLFFCSRAARWRAWVWEILGPGHYPWYTLGTRQKFTLAEGSTWSLPGWGLENSGFPLNPPVLLGSVEPIWAGHKKSLSGLPSVPSHLGFALLIHKNLTFTVRRPLSKRLWSLQWIFKVYFKNPNQEWLSLVSLLRWPLLGALDTLWFCFKGALG